MSDDPALHSRRPLTLRFDIPISRTREFWDGLRDGRFITTKCKNCGNVSFPPQADCPNCMKGEFEWVDLGRDAKLLTFTYVQVTPASFVENDPYIIAIGELAKGLKVLAWLEGIGPEDAKLGMAMRIEFRASKEGNPYYVFVKA
ncbi:MAG: Zn-ribbon domain-containing OB-fold protein [Thaumarchaeota archaeon]|nr:Zn-ribbon domain-containing OB-fold protein [Nitrososphaerota archaeon]